jgi:hypothetical protein
MVEKLPPDEELEALVTPENLHELFLHAWRINHATFRAIWRGVGFQHSEATFNKKVNQSHGKRFSPGDLELARPYIRRDLQESLRWLAEKVRHDSEQSNTTVALRRSIDKAISLQAQLADFHGTTKELPEWHRVGLQSYYYSFKYSYREDRKILRSAAAILTLSHSRRSPRETATVFIERHFNRPDGALEDTAGLVYDDKRGKLWIEAIESMMEQPRKFVLTRRVVGRERRPLPNSRSRARDEQIQVMTGFILGGYAKHPNAEGNENGVFASPYVLQRVPATKLQAVLSEINDDVLSQINNEELYTFETADQVLTELSNAQDYLTEQDLTTDETIYDEVPRHLRYYRLWDSNRPPDRVGEQEG